MHKIAGRGGSEFGMYVDGFPHRIVICFHDSEQQRKSLENVLAEWGGRITEVSVYDVIERQPPWSKKEKAWGCFYALGLLCYMIIWAPFVGYERLKKNGKTIGKNDRSNDCVGCTETSISCCLGKKNS